jgi:hypothetical protein
VDWENVILTILGGFLAGFSGILIEQWREGRRLRKRHFKDIKDKCLKPVLEELYHLKTNFEFGEGRCGWASSQKIEDHLKSDIHWWKIFSFKNGPKVHPLLYEDLKTIIQTYTKICKTLKHGLRVIMQSIYRQSSNCSEPLKKIKNSKHFEKESEKAYLNATSSYLLEAIFLLALSVDKYNWPNIYEYIRPKLDEIKNL